MSAPARIRVMIPLALDPGPPGVGPAGRAAQGGGETFVVEPGAGTPADVPVSAPAAGAGPDARRRRAGLPADRPGAGIPLFKEIGEKRDAWIDKPAAELPVAEARSSSIVAAIQDRADRVRCPPAVVRLVLHPPRAAGAGLRDPPARRPGDAATGSGSWRSRRRVETLEGRFDEATRTAETGFAFARHVGEGPFLINGLVGVAMANVTLARLEELVTAPAPRTSTGR